MEDLDDTHVMIAPEKVDRVRAMLENEVCRRDRRGCHPKTLRHLPIFQLEKNAFSLEPTLP